jgi:hypothetical protein
MSFEGFVLKTHNQTLFQNQQFGIISFIAYLISFSSEKE